MCGIAGIWRFNGKVSKDEIKSFTDSMHHRGPDGAGYEVFENDNLAFGHRRLSILDLSEAGKQPMSYADKRYWLTFNGEVYNFIEIKKELEIKGYHFISSTDSEVILAAYIEWGKECFLKFNGMWAIAIWDSHEKKLLLCRDRYGVKPLHYYFERGKQFAFASETLAFKYLQQFIRSIDAGNLTFAINNPTLLEPTGETIFKGVMQLKAGHIAELQQNGNLIIKRWWNTAEHIKPVNMPYEQQVERFKDLFFNAVKLRLRSDVSIASALSGGIDSSSVFCSINYLSKHSNGFERLPSNWQQAYSISFPGTSVDEAGYVKLIRDKLNAEVKILEPDYKNLITDIESTTQLFDSVTGTPLIALTDVYKGMHTHGITVSMDGHGGDELLFGYSSSVYKAVSDSFKINAVDRRNLVEIYLSLGKENVTEAEIDMACNKIATQTQAKGTSRFSVIKKKIRQILIATRPLLNADNPLIGEKQLKQFKNYDMLAPGYFSEANAFLFNEFHYNEIPYNLRDFDRASMQNQIEIRMPLMDYRLVDFCFSLPVSSKVGHNHTKRILRDAMKGIVPDEILNRRTKIGLGAPTKEWFNGPLNAYIRDVVNSSAFLNSNYWNGKQVSAFVNDKCLNKSWDYSDARDFWKILNAHLVCHDNL